MPVPYYEAYKDDPDYRLQLMLQTVVEQPELLNDSVYHSFFLMALDTPSLRFIMSEELRKLNKNPVDFIYALHAKNKPVSEAKDFNPIQLTKILGTYFPDPEWIVYGLIPEGLTIIGGLPKAAKSYVAYDISLSVAGYGPALGHFVTPKGKALYMAVEDDQKDTQARTFELRNGNKQIDNLYFVHGENVPTFSEGLLSRIEEKVIEHQFKLVVVDPLSYVYDPPQGRGMSQDSFREAKESLLPFRQLARRLGFSLIFVDHRRKQGKDDVDIFQSLYGSVAKYAIADSLIMVVRNKEEIVLHCRGRKIKDQVIYFDFTRNDETSTFEWKFKGAGEHYTDMTLQRQVVDIFKEQDTKGNRVMTVPELADFLEVPDTRASHERLRNILFQLRKKAVIGRAEGKGKYFFMGDPDDNDEGAAVEI